MDFFELRIRKEALKFACCHMTVFPDGKKEPMHGHQYVPEVRIRIKDVSLKAMIPFAEVKEAMKEIAGAWDERVLLAARNPHYRALARENGELEFELCGKRYVIPAEEAVELPIDNVTCEQLARHYHALLSVRLPWLQAGLKNGSVSRVEVSIEESRGQGAAYVSGSGEGE